MNSNKFFDANLGLLFAVVVASAAPAYSAELSDAAVLRKMSLSLQGRLPSPQDYKELEMSKQGGQKDSFLQEKAATYARSRSGVERLAERIRILFRFGPTYYERARRGPLFDQAAQGTLKKEDYPKTIYVGEDQGKPTPSADEILYSLYDPATTLMLDVARGAKSWDRLFNSRTYRFMSGLGGAAELNFFSTLNPLLPPTVDSFLRQSRRSQYRPDSPYPGLHLVEIGFNPRDPRVAGIFTTRRFNSRFSTTFLNQNRGRASQFFRIGLCDSMTPVVMLDDTQTREALELATPSSDNGSTDLTVNAHAAMEKKHGSDPQCMACHYKLDPAGKTFQNTTGALSVSAAPGGLVYKDRKGNLINLQVRGIGDLADQLIQQSEYAACQVRHFWKWTVGEDVSLSDTRLQELVADFEKTGRVAPTFLAKLANTPEFRQSPDSGNQSPLETARTRVKPIISQCVACHDGSSAPVPDFSNFPFEGSKESHRLWVEKIKTMTTPNEKGESLMPPSWSGWKMSGDERTRLDAWIQEELK